MPIYYNQYDSILNFFVFLNYFYKGCVSLLIGRDGGWFGCVTWCINRKDSAACDRSETDSNRSEKNVIEKKRIEEIRIVVAEKKTGWKPARTVCIF